MLYVMLFCEYPFERPEDEQHPHKFQKMLERTKRLDYRLGSPHSQQLTGVAYCSSLHRTTMPYQEPFANRGTSAHLNSASASGKSKGAARLLCGCLPELPVPCNFGQSSHWCPHAAEGCTALQSRRLPGRAACKPCDWLQCAAVHASPFNPRAVGLSCAAVCEGSPNPFLCPSRVRTSSRASLSWSPLSAPASSKSR